MTPSQRQPHKKQLCKKAQQELRQPASWQREPMSNNTTTFGKPPLSCLVLSCLVLSYLVLSCLVVSCLVLSCLAWSGLVLPGLVWSGLVWSGLGLIFVLLFDLANVHVSIAVIIFTFFFLVTSIFGQRYA